MTKPARKEKKRKRNKSRTPTNLTHQTAPDYKWQKWPTSEQNRKWANVWKHLAKMPSLQLFFFQFCCLSYNYAVQNMHISVYFVRNVEWEKIIDLRNRASFWYSETGAVETWGMISIGYNWMHMTDLQSCNMLHSVWHYAVQIRNTEKTEIILDRKKCALYNKKSLNAQ